MAVAHGAAGSCDGVLLRLYISNRKFKLREYEIQCHLQATSCSAWSTPPASSPWPPPWCWSTCSAATRCSTAKPSSNISWQCFMARSIAAMSLLQRGQCAGHKATKVLAVLMRRSTPYQVFVPVTRLHQGCWQPNSRWQLNWPADAACPTPPTAPLTLCRTVPLQCTTCWSS